MRKPCPRSASPCVASASSAWKRSTASQCSSGAQVIDGSGKMLLPGLWDMHQHLSADNAFLDVAAGITTIRDLGNPIDELGKLKTHIEQGEQVGPRIILAGLIDGPGPFPGSDQSAGCNPGRGAAVRRPLRRSRLRADQDLQLGEAGTGARHHRRGPQARAARQRTRACRHGRVAVRARKAPTKFST